MTDPEEITALQTALSFSPENVALRLHLIRTLQKYGRWEQSVEIANEGLAEQPVEDTPLLELLAAAYAQLEKRDEAFVILESLEKQNALGPQSTLLYAQLLSQTTELVKAAEVYRALQENHPEFADENSKKSLRRSCSTPQKTYSGSPLASNPSAPSKHPSAHSLNSMTSAAWSQVKEDIRMKIIHPIQNADLFRAYGKAVGGGILLYGPPGCGKTFLARATAGEVEANFYNVGLHDVLDMWIGQSEKNLHELFTQARAANPACSSSTRSMHSEPVAQT